MTEALVNPAMLRWARERAAMPVDLLAGKLGTKPEKVADWETGAARPTFNQAERLAEAVHVPFGYLFLAEPPAEDLPIPDLRTVRDTPPGRFSLDFMDLLRDVLFKHTWYREHLIETGAPKLPFVGRFRPDAPTETVAADIRLTLGISPAIRTTRNAEEYVNDLSEAAEAVGIWVMRTGFVGANVHRIFNVAEFRGFAIVDDLAPLVLINGRDAKAAQVFTLAHELAHIWLGQSGVSNPAIDAMPDGGIERTCNAIAAETLVPAAEFAPMWQRDVGIELNAAALSRQFKVSRIVIARRALDLGLISREAFFAFHQQEAKRWQDMEGSGKGNYYLNMPVKNGKRFTRAVVDNAVSGHLLLRDAGALLHMKPAHVVGLHRRQNTGTD